MNSVVIAIIGIVALSAGYKIYGRIIEKIWDIEPERETPAHAQCDKVDYVPAKHWTVLFGHHFASIAGAGPILGPVIACFYWGWLGALIWLIFGSIFIGAVHDFSALMVSVRNKGKSIAHICDDTLGKSTKVVFSLFLWLSLVLVVAVFAAVGAKTMAAKPEIVIPALGIIPVAVLVGLLMYRTSVSQIITTVIGLALLVILVIWGKNQPVDISGYTSDPARVWTIVLLVYAFIASILPVNILLQPRDYLSTFLLFFGLLAGYLGVLITHPVMRAPAVISFSSANGPLWPMMFVIIACGAISGFHSIVASGTTAKQLSSERNALRIGFGAMITEGALALLALIAVCAGLHWTPGIAGVPVYAETMKKGWIVAFSEGFGQLTLPLFGGFGVLIAATILNAFIITTLDTATRITRYITEELFGITNKYLSTSIITLLALYLAMGNWRKIWPVFGASNQLVAALGLLIISVYLLYKKKEAKFTIIPGVIMLLTSGGALIWQLNNFISERNYLLAVIAAVLLLLAAYISVLTFKFFKGKRRLNESPA
ncbi:carbon starvation protein A [Elusimicrobiota bacterium]